MAPTLRIGNNTDGTCRMECIWQNLQCRQQRTSASRSYFPVWMLKKLQWHMTLIEVFEVQKSGLGAKIRISLVNQISSFVQSWSRVGGKQRTALGLRETAPHCQWQCMTLGCLGFQFHVNIYKLFQSKLKPVVTITFPQLLKIAQDVTHPVFGSGMICNRQVVLASFVNSRFPHFC